MYHLTASVRSSEINPLYKCSTFSPSRSLIRRSKTPLPEVPELDPHLYGFDQITLNEALNDNSSATGEDFLSHLKSVYSSQIAVEFMHLQNMNERKWFAEAYEKLFAEELSDAEKVEALEVMLRAKAWEKFLGSKFPTLKRYSGEGSESAVGLYSYLLENCGQYGIKEIRGKSEFPDDLQGVGDVLTHQTSHFEYINQDGDTMHVSTLPNPSHLEVSPAMAVGKARARAQTLQLGDYCQGGRTGDGILCVHHHGDGAFTGQGIVWETIGMCQIPHFRVGGSIHVVINNQVAFTAEKGIGRSSLHCTDIAKAVDCPVIHVNGENVENVLQAGKLALKYRQMYRKDVFINMMCYRRYGHNELDDPTFTQPIMYKVIKQQKCLVDKYSEKLSAEGIYSLEQAAQCFQSHNNELAEQLEAVDADKVAASVDRLQGSWEGFTQAPAAVTQWDTGVNEDLLRFIGAKSVELPAENFNVHPHIRKTHIDARLARLKKGTAIDWSTAESLAFGSLLLQNYGVRLCGQDVANSPLTEFAVLAFEYGFSTENPRRLVIWEAQFGDFYNGAQIVIDNLIATSENIERFLQLTDSKESQCPVDGDNVNMLLQMITPYRKPMVIIAPKLLLRHPMAMSPIEDFGPNSYFKPVIYDFTNVESKNVKKLIFTSGKHAVTLEAEIHQRNISDTAVVRLESICPFPAEELKKAVDNFPNANVYVWSQEEPKNAGM
uniref:Transketolase-like pyrimidine-binding domain-containing protein n=1 Tax=Ditylenchus dipsaci TaxID=166011 RepID=A0A915D301_9BILA